MDTTTSERKSIHDPLKSLNHKMLPLPTLRGARASGAEEGERRRRRREGKGAPSFITTSSHMTWYIYYGDIMNSSVKKCFVSSVSPTKPFFSAPQFWELNDTWYVGGKGTLHMSSITVQQCRKNISPPDRAKVNRPIQK